MPKNEQDNSNNAITPQEISFPLSGCALTINANCGMCRHFSRMAHPAFKEVCQKKGIIEVSKPCVRYQADPRQLRFYEESHMVAFAEFLATVPTSKLPLLASIFNQEHRTRKRKYHFGEIIYIHAFGQEYISNYRRCRILVVERDLATVEGEGNLIASVMLKSVLNAKQWKKRKAELQAAKRVKDPNYKRHFKVSTKIEKEIKKAIETLTPPMLNDSIIGKPVLVALHKESNLRPVKKASKKAVLFNAIKPNIATTPVDELIRVRGGGK